MVTIPVKVKDRLISGVKKFQPIVAKAQAKDINESDTVTIILDILSDVFGYDKFLEITSEYAIKKTYVDLAIKLNGVPKLLIEAKAAGLDLKDQHIKQAVDYGSNSGVEWVILTNGADWRVYNISFGKPVSADLVYQFNFSKISVKKQADLETLYYLTREAMTKGNKSALDEFHNQQQIVNRFTLAHIILSDTVLDTIRRSLRKMSSDTKVSNEEIQKILLDEVIKRDILDDEKAADAKKKVQKALKTPAKSTVKKSISVLTDNDSE